MISFWRQGDEEWACKQLLASSRLWLQLDAAEQEARRPGNAQGSGELVSAL
jgi:hypothetical protein